MTTYNGKSLVFETQVSTEICSTDDKSADRPHPTKENQGLFRPYAGKGTVGKQIHKYSPDLVMNLIKQS